MAKTINAKPNIAIPISNTNSDRTKTGATIKRSIEKTTVILSRKSFTDNQLDNRLDSKNDAIMPITDIKASNPPAQRLFPAMRIWIEPEFNIATTTATISPIIITAANFLPNIFTSFTRFYLFIDKWGFFCKRAGGKQKKPKRAYKFVKSIRLIRLPIESVVFINNNAAVGFRIRCLKGRTVALFWL